VKEALTDVELRFIFQQAEKRVKETADDGDKIYNKSITLVSICLTLLTALCGFIFNNFAISPLIAGAVLVALVLLNVSVILKKNIYPVKYRSIGSHPKDLLTDGYYENLEKNRKPEWYLLYSEIMAYEERLHDNMANNNVRNERLKSAYKWLYRMPIIFVLTYCMTTFFQSLT
jgi:hypothetical protein